MEYLIEYLNEVYGVVEVEKSTIPNHTNISFFAKGFGSSNLESIMSYTCFKFFYIAVIQDKLYVNITVKNESVN